MDLPGLGNFRREFPNIEVAEADGALHFGLPGQDPLLSLSDEGETWRVWTNEWHGHYKDPQYALLAVVAILDGTARTATEFRGDTLSATWLELFDGHAYAVNNVALYLNPFDVDSWELWPGERWRVVRRVRRLIEGGHPEASPDVELGQILEWEKLAETVSCAPEAWMRTWCDEHYGPPVDGLKWSFDISNRFVFQAPRGWRTEPDPVAETEWPGVALRPVGGDQAMRVRTAFSDAEEAERYDLVEDPVLPSSVSYTFEPVCSTGPGWLMHAWNLLFSNGQEKMMAEVRFYQRLSSPVPHELWRVKLDAGLRASLFVFPGS